MPAELIAFVPTALAVSLLALAHGLTPKPQGWALIGLVAFVAGPVAVSVMGFFPWLAAVAVLVVALTIYAALRNPPPTIRTPRTR